MKNSQIKTSAYSVCANRCAEVGDPPCRVAVGSGYNEETDCPADIKCADIAAGKYVSDAESCWLNARYAGEAMNKTSAKGVDFLDIGWLAFFLAVNRYPENPHSYIAGFFDELERMTKESGDGR